MAAPRSERGVEDDGVRLPFDFARSGCQLLVILSTVVLLAGPVLVDQFGDGRLSTAEKVALGGAWLFHLVSVLLGLLLLFLLVAAVSPTTTITVEKDGKKAERVVDRIDQPPSVHQPSIAALGGMQLAGFGLGLLCLTVLGWLQL